MSTPSDEEEEDEEEEFYEPLDRILSSSCSSTSASDDDDADAHHHRRRGRHHLPRFPPLSAVSLDVWISEPASVEERRRRLLQQLGLAGDPALARLKSPAAGEAGIREGEIGRSVSSDGLCRRPGSSSAAAAAVGPAIARSRSDGSVDPGPVYNQLQLERPQVHCHQRAIHMPVSSKPLLVGRTRPASGGNLEASDADGGGGDRREDGDDGDDDDDPRYLIKNLDNGREFVVKEFREDGMWNKLREVGTGRQLTMEEFDMCVGLSPIVQELMRRQNVEESAKGSGLGALGGEPRAGAGSAGAMRSKKRGSWLRSIKNVAGSVVAGGHHRDPRSSDEKDTSSEKGGRRSSSATDDSQDGLRSLRHHHGPERTKVRQYGKSHKELSGLYMTQEIQAHKGSIWCIKFSLDGRYLASAGEDCVIHVWEVTEYERKGELPVEREDNGSCNPFAAISNGSPEPTLALACVEGNNWEKKRRANVPGGRKSMASDHLMVPDHLFALSEKPVCSFRGHSDDILDLSWSKSQYLLSSSMDKTVRLWHMSSNSCLKTFSHSDYVTCIQFNPVDDRYFISGSLDEKVRIWSIPDRQIVDWNDLHEMVTAACYTPDGQGALVGSHKGSCLLYDTSDNKLVQKCQIDLQNKKKKSSHKKITGFQFAPGSFSKVLITSADSRIRVIDGVELVHKFKGFRNTSSQISACVTVDGKYVICASEDSHVFAWKYDDDSQPSRSKGVATVMHSYEHFHCRDVTVAVPWPTSSMGGKPGTRCDRLNGVSKANPQLLVEANGHQHSPFPACRYIDINSSNYCDKVSATWPEELMTANKQSPPSIGDISDGGMPGQSRSAWGLVILTASRGGEIRTFQNFGFPIRV
ncbi:WD repeat-containing protein 44-like [Phoenix dactylifera]|uniref:WD repeat-containing protein 44-like n=1 Tax=Phoenix dactylifera TaxID=42345 RepID=A0A8B8ZN07_PHODC|nr:WD repeat-containing protein 44-like [Phoenix dactylifera]